MERAQGVSSGPRGPESMVMVCFIASFVKRDTIPIPKATISQREREREREREKEREKPPRAVYLIANRPCLFYHLGYSLICDLTSDHASL
jgi:hypothetical protein